LAYELVARVRRVSYRFANSAGTSLHYGEKQMTRFVAAMLLIAALVAMPAAAQTSPVSIPITGNGAQGTNFTGNLTLTNFALNSSGQLVANGILSGTLSRGNNTLGSVLQTVTFLVDTAQSSATACQILHLELGPLDLNLLGLRVQLNRVVLDITAIPGGGLLGDLLCSIANLLNPNAALVNTLNQILAALRGLAG
jgi:hypothetical protein